MPDYARRTYKKIWFAADIGQIALNHMRVYRFIGFGRPARSPTCHAGHAAFAAL